MISPDSEANLNESHRIGTDLFYNACFTGFITVLKLLAYFAASRKRFDHYRQNLIRYYQKYKRFPSLFRNRIFRQKKKHFSDP